MSKTRIDTSVYVDFAALNEWKSQMDKINVSALDTLDSFMSSVEELKGSWCGNSADSFLNSSKMMLNKAKSYHTEMRNVENFLTTVINTMDNQ
jgi:uncharacterized protein YukE